MDIGLAVKDAEDAKKKINADFDNLRLISKRSLARLKGRDILTYGEVQKIAENLNDPVKFLGRIAKDMNFPFKLDYQSDISRKVLDEANVSFSCSKVYFQCNNNYAIAERLNQAGIDAESSMDTLLNIDALDFYLNSDELIKILPKYAITYNNPEKNISEAQSKLQQAKDVLGRYLNFQKMSFSGMRPLSMMNAEQDILSEEGADPVTRYFLENSVPFTWQSLQEHLPMANISKSEKLFLERLKELAPQVTDAETGKALLSTLSPVDAVVIGSLFSRAAIDEYANEKDQMRLLSTELSENVRYGSCRHASGLALQFIRRMIQPNNPRLKDWFFGVYTTEIEDYSHGEMVVAHHYRSKCQDRIGVYFADPTKLVGNAKELYDNSKDFDLKRLDSTTDNYHFFRIERTGDDFIATPFNMEYQGKRSLLDVMKSKIEGR
jgi:hypothetical protein